MPLTMEALSASSSSTDFLKPTGITQIASMVDNNNDDDYTDDFDDNDENNNAQQSQSHSQTQPQSQQAKPTSMHKPSAVPMPALTTPIPPHSHRYYRISVDLRTLSLSRPASLSSAFSLSYRHTLLGDAVTTSECRVGHNEQSVTVAQSFSLFEFVTAADQLQRAIQEEPLVITLVQLPANTIAATSAVNLCHLLTAPLYNENVRVIDAEVGLHGETQYNAATLTIDKPFDLLRDHDQRIANVHIVCTLQDLGPVSDEYQQQHFIQQQQVAAQPPISLSSSAMDARATTEYQVAWELELWRRTEQAKHEKQWEITLNQRLNQLEAEYKHLTLQREQQFSIKLKEIINLEKKLQNNLFDISNQEKKLHIQREDIERKLIIIKQDTQRITEEAHLTNTRLKESHSHTLTLHKRTVTDLSSQIDLLRTKLTAEESRYRYLEEMYQKYRTQMSKSTTGELRSMINERDLIIKSIKSELELEKSKNLNLEQTIFEYKSENERLRTEMDERERLHIAKEKREAETLRLEFHAKSRSVGMRRDVEELFDIRRKIKDLTESKSATTSTQKTRAGVSGLSLDPLTQSALGSFRTSGAAAAAALAHSSHTASLPLTSSLHQPVPMTFYEKFSLEQALSTHEDDVDDDVIDENTTNKSSRTPQQLSPSLSPAHSPSSSVQASPSEHKEFAQSNGLVLEQMHLRPLTAIHVATHDESTDAKQTSNDNNRKAVSTEDAHTHTLTRSQLDDSPTRSETSTAISVMTAGTSVSKSLPTSARRPLKKVTMTTPSNNVNNTQPRRTPTLTKTNNRSRPISKAATNTRTLSSLAHSSSQSMTIDHSSRPTSPAITITTPEHTHNQRRVQTLRTTQSPQLPTNHALSIPIVNSTSFATVRAGDDTKVHTSRNVYVDESKAKASVDVTRTSNSRGLTSSLSRVNDRKLSSS